MKGHLFVGGIIAVALCIGCSRIHLPSAKGYSVQVGNTEYYAHSVKIHGQWIEMETEKGPMWANSAAVVFIRPRN